MSEERFGRIDKTPEDVRERFDGIDRRFDAIDGRLDGIDHRLDDLGRHIRGTARRGHRPYSEHCRPDAHYSARRFAALSVALSLTKGEFKAADAEVLESINRRLDPLELTVRDHSAQLAKRRRC